MDTRENMQVGWWPGWPLSRGECGERRRIPGETCRHCDLFYCLLFSQSQSKKSRLMSQPSCAERDVKLYSFIVNTMNDKYCVYHRVTDCMTDDTVTNMMHDISLPDKLTNCMTKCHDRDCMTASESGGCSLARLQSGPHSFKIGPT